MTIWVAQKTTSPLATVRTWPIDNAQEAADQVTPSGADQLYRELRGASWTDRAPALPRARNKGHAARAGARRIYASAIAATRALWAIEPAYDDKTLFRLDVWITTGAAGRRDHRRLARIRRRRFHSSINVGRADYTMSLAELFAKRLIAALLLAAGF